MHAFFEGMTVTECHSFLELLKVAGQGFSASGPQKQRKAAISCGSPTVVTEQANEGFLSIRLLREQRGILLGKARRRSGMDPLLFGSGPVVTEGRLFLLAHPWS
jgi:hypothetical protein